MPQVLNFDVVAVETIEITKNGQTYVLKDNVPAETMLQRFALTPERYGLTGETLTDGADLDDALVEVDRMKHDVAHLVGEIFRWSLPETTDELIYGLFSLDEMFQIISLFSTRLGGTSSPPQGATPATSAKRTPAARRRK